MLIRTARPDDHDAIASIIMPVIRAGETYALAPGMPEAAALDYWFAPDNETFVAELGGDVVGTYFLHANQRGGGRHVANCGYITDAKARGKGVARRMCEHSLALATSQGYRAMQFNFVISTNEAAISLWQSLKFETVGRLPLAFEHPRFGYVDALVMFRLLSD
jgi:ribosomal protein S18 acetylase RimI-like enzyme